MILVITSQFLLGAIYMKILSFITVIGLITITGCSSKAERGFKSSCQSGGMDRSTCSCIYDALEDHYGVDKLEKMMNQNINAAANPNMLPADFGDVFTQSVYKCAPH